MRALVVNEHFYPAHPPKQVLTNVFLTNLHRKNLFRLSSVRRLKLRISITRTIHSRAVVPNLKKMKRIFTFTLFLFSLLISKSQELFDFHIKNDYQGFAYSAVQLDTISIYSAGFENNIPLIVKTDLKGNEIWTKKLDDYGTSLKSISIIELSPKSL